MPTEPARSPIGARIHVVGNTCSGKSTLAARLANVLGVPAVELDALNWESNWVSVRDTNPAEFERRLVEATDGDGWVVAGSYMEDTQRLVWPRLETVIWLDLPLAQILWRVCARSWRRWRTRERLWGGTNTEHFGRHLKLWSEESLFHWAVMSHRRKRARGLADMTDPRWAHIRFIRLTSSREVEAFARRVEAAVRVPS